MLSRRFDLEAEELERVALVDLVASEVPAAAPRLLDPLRGVDELLDASLDLVALLLPAIVT